MNDETSQLAENPLIILGAYITVLLPWAILAASDYINDRFDTVQNIRYAGIFQLALSILPSGYIIFYIILQNDSQDYKEMAAAMAALLLNVIHFMRTINGLLQLSHFVAWAENAIDCLQSLGYEDNRVKNADDLRINHDIIDNEVSGGDLHVQFRFRSRVTARWRRDAVNSWYSRPKLESLHHHHQETQINVIKRSFFILFQRIMRRIKHVYLWSQFQLATRWFSQHSTPSKGGRISFEPEPEDPAEAFIRWTITVLAQCAPDFMLEARDCLRPKVDYTIQALHIWGLAIMCITADPMLSAGETEVPSASQDVATDGSEQVEGMFSVITPSAALSFLQGEKLKDRTILGLLTLKKTHAFPYCAAVRPGNLGVKKSYRWLLDTSLEEVESASDMLNRFFHQSRIKPAITGLPPDLQNEQTLGISANSLLWFMIYLTTHNEGNWWRYREIIQHSDVDVPTVRFRAGMAADLFQDDDPDEQEVRLFWKEHFPSAILRSQLGIIDQVYSNPHCSPLPVLGLNYGPKLWRHPHVLQVTAHIDNIIALRCGTEMSRMESGGTKNLNQDVMSKTSEARKSDNTQPQSEVHEAQFDIGAEHLAWWINEGDDKSDRQSISREFEFHSSLRFMGALMECLRSELALAYEQEAGKKGRYEVAEDWVVNAPLPINKHLYFEPSKQLRDTLTTNSNPEQLDSKLVQLRILWECQSHAYFTTGTEWRDLRHHAPTSLSAMILCILAFPALWMKRPTPSGAKNCLYRFEVRPMRAPQDLALRIDVLDSMKMSMSICSLTSTTSTPQLFHWQQWRDAFVGRLEAFERFQCSYSSKSPGFPGLFAPLRPMNSSIERWERRRNVDIVRLWHGWPPFRPAIALFEGSPYGMFQSGIAENLVARILEPDS